LQLTKFQYLNLINYNLLIEMRTKSLIFISLFFLIVSLKAQESRLLFKDGDRVCFIGNSITHSGEFHPDIFLYYATRFPKEKITFINCGVSGDAANEILTRLDSDVFVHKPTIAAFMVGMNDMIRGFKGGTVNENTYPPYYKFTSQIADKLKDYGCKLIVELPSIYDQTSETGPKPSIGVNDALGKCADYLKSIAPKYNAVVVDYWTILKDINEKEQLKDKKFTIVGSDRVHPGSVGHLVMAYQFLKTTGAPMYVSKLAIDAKTKKVTESLNCEVKLESVKKNGLQFESLEKALPYPVKKEAVPALDLIPFTKDLNQEILQIQNLKKGNYDLLIDEMNVGKYNSSDLGQGINLSMNSITPQYKQALEVMKACDDYRKVMMDLRAIAFVEYKTLSKYKDDPNDLTAIRTYINEELGKIKDKSQYDYIKGQCSKYLVLKPKQQQLKVQLNQIREQIYVVNIPRKHLFKLEFSAK
jgi:lysophospholipase L1-like esterase